MNAFIAKSKKTCTFVTKFKKDTNEFEKYILVVALAVFQL
jgi:hypothetical protein